MKISTRIKFFPISFFAIVMGLSGFSLAFRQVSEIYQLSSIIYLGILSLSIAVFIILLFFYALKFFYYKTAVVKEWNHPIAMSFFPSFSISLLLLAVAILPLNTMVSLSIWVIGCLLHLFLTLAIFNQWLFQEHFEIKHMNPAWFIPAVGNAIVPLAGVPLGFVQISWFFFSIGLFFWLILMVIVFYRMIFHHPLPEKLMPTLFILIAPPAVCFLAYTLLIDGLDPFAHLLYYFAVFMSLLLLVRIRLFLKQNFYLSWWAFSFPIAAISIASFKMAYLSGIGHFGIIGLFLLSLLSPLIGYLIFKTIKGVLNKKICQAET